jgi:hypothetical protein
MNTERNEVTYSVQYLKLCEYYLTARNAGYQTVVKNIVWTEQKHFLEDLLCGVVCEEIEKQ